MILVTVGTQLAFDRLIRAMDVLAGNLGVPVIAQTGDGEYAPKNMVVRSRIPPAEFNELATASDLLVGHAGTGTILTASKFHKPVVLLPRRASLGEHRNDHQLATAKAFEKRAGVFVAMEEGDLEKAIREAQNFDTSRQDYHASSNAIQNSLQEFLKQWVH